MQAIIFVSFFAYLKFKPLEVGYYVIARLAAIAQALCIILCLFKPLEVVYVLALL